MTKINPPCLHGQGDIWLGARRVSGGIGPEPPPQADPRGSISGGDAGQEPRDSAGRDLLARGEGAGLAAPAAWAGPSGFARHAGAFWVLPSAQAWTRSVPVFGLATMDV